MTTLVPILLLAQAGANRLFDASLAAHSKLISGKVHIESTTKLPTGTTSAVYDVTFVRNGATLIRVREPRQAGKDRSDRTFFVKGTQFVGHDAVANEVLKRTVPAKGSGLEKLTSVLGQVDDSVRAVLSPAALREFYQPFRGLGGWSTSKSGTTTILSRSSKNGDASFGFKNGLLTGLSLRTGDSTLTWQITYAAAPKAITFSPPKGAKPVSAFLATPEPPRYANAETEQVARAMLRAYSAIQSGTVFIQSEDGNTRIMMSRPRYREDSPGLQWVYDGATLSILDRESGKFYRGKAKRSDIVDYVGETGNRVHPFIREVLANVTPYQTLLAPHATVKKVGQMTFNTVPVDILQVSTSQNRTSLYIRRDNRLLHSLTTDTLDEEGDVVGSITRRFTYTNLNKTLPASDFGLRPIGSVLPLPKLKSSGE